MDHAPIIERVEMDKWNDNHILACVFDNKSIWSPKFDPAQHESARQSVCCEIPSKAQPMSA